MKEWLQQCSGCSCDHGSLAPPPPTGLPGPGSQSASHWHRFPLKIMPFPDEGPQQRPVNVRMQRSSLVLNLEKVYGPSQPQSKHPVGPPELSMVRHWGQPPFCPLLPCTGVPPINLLPVVLHLPLSRDSTLPREAQLWRLSSWRSSRMLAGGQRASQPRTGTSGEGKHQRLLNTSKDQAAEGRGPGPGTMPCGMVGAGGCWIEPHLLGGVVRSWLPQRPGTWRNRTLGSSSKVLGVFQPLQIPTHPPPHPPCHFQAPFTTRM